MISVVFNNWDKSGLSTSIIVTILRRVFKVMLGGACRSRNFRGRPMSSFGLNLRNKLYQI